MATRSEFPGMNDYMNYSSINAKTPSKKLYHLTLNLISTSHLITTMANKHFFEIFEALYHRL